jgi:hypothetical protein
MIPIIPWCTLGRRYSNFCCRLCKLFYFWWINVSGLHVIKGALHILKKNKKKTKGLTIYCIIFVNETWFCCLVIFIRYLNGLAALLIPWCTLGDPLPYIPGSYHKTTTFVIESNAASPLRYLINITRQQNQVSLTKMIQYIYYEKGLNFYWILFL